MKPYFYTTVLIITILLPLSIHANTFCVSDATGLQTALTTASTNGEDDTVQIVQGTYVGSFIYTSTEAFSLTVEGGYIGSCSSRIVDPASTVLDANNSGPVLVLSCPDAPSNFIVDGLTLQNGVKNINDAGGLYVTTTGSVNLTNNTITENDGFGAYIYRTFAELNLINNTITYNSYGGVYALWPTTVSMMNNNISFNNGPASDKDAIFVASHYPVSLLNNVVSYNTNSRAIRIDVDEQTNLQNNFIHGNSGMGVYSDSRLIPSSSFIMTKNTVTNNGARGVHVEETTSVTFTNNTISYNNGGGISTRINTTTTMNNNTITGNIANAEGAGIKIILYENGDVANIINNIIWNNSASLSGNDLYINNDENVDYSPSTVNLYNNDFDQSTAGTYIELPFTIDPSNLDNEDPLFVNAPSGDYHLTGLSPCIDEGRLEGAPPDDMDGHPRPQGDGVDIGADERIPLDADDDGVPNEVDNCPFDVNPDQTDTDHDCIGDECDDFPNDYDPTVPDFDGDGIGDACDVCPYDLNDDIDADGLCGNEDNCPDIPNGPNLGSCINILTGIVGTTCINDGECGTGETCSNNQEDRDNNGAGDACDIGTFCRGLADFDQDVDANDVTVFLSHFGRSPFNNPCPPDGPTPVCKSGQTISYATGDDGDHERGVGLVTPRFTDHSDGTVTDNQTGLIWLRDANCFGQKTWDNAVSDSNGLASGSCGLTDGSGAGDWRLPSLFELESLRNLAYYNPAISNTAGTGQWSEGDSFINQQSSNYWSSTTSAHDTSYAYYLYFGSGYVYGDIKSSSSYYVWPVRGGH